MRSKIERHSDMENDTSVPLEKIVTLFSAALGLRSAPRPPLSVPLNIVNPMAFMSPSSSEVLLEKRGVRTTGARCCAAHLGEIHLHLDTALR